ncbi:AT-hook motif nuclear-localized protein 1 [Tanacetum coccineum]
MVPVDNGCGEVGMPRISHLKSTPSQDTGPMQYAEDLKFLKLSGSFTRGESEGVTSREGGMSIALSSLGGRVVGGIHSCLFTRQLDNIKGVLVQVVFRKFIPSVSRSGYDIERKKRLHQQVSCTVAATGIHVMMEIASDTIGSICQACVGKFRTISPSKYPPPRRLKSKSDVFHKCNFRPDPT